MPTYFIVLIEKKQLVTCVKTSFYFGEMTDLR
jgi:hypothetical protein